MESLSYLTHRNEVEEMQNIINSGRFFSVTFIKADGSIRYVAGKKPTYQSTSPESEKRGKYNRLEKNLLLVWDINKRYNNKEGEEVRGAYISARLDRILFFKSGQFVKDFTQENEEAIRVAGISPGDIEKIKNKMNINDIIQQEALNLFENLFKLSAANI